MICFIHPKTASRKGAADITSPDCSSFPPALLILALFSLFLYTTLSLSCLHSTVYYPFFRSPVTLLTLFALFTLYLHSLQPFLTILLPKMKSFFLSLALASASAAQSCYKSAGPNALVLPTSPYLSQSYCQSLCANHGFSVAATNNGQECACSYQLPAKEEQVDDRECNVKCPGYPQQNCKFIYLFIYFSF